jgi:multidrug efflux pump subunit AcrB
VIARLNNALQPVWGITLYMQAAQDITIGGRLSKTQYQYTLVDVDSDELDHWAPILLKRLQTLPQLTDVASDQQSTGRVLKIDVNRQLASQLGIREPNRPSGDETQVNRAGASWASEKPVFDRSR